MDMISNNYTVLFSSDYVINVFLPSHGTKRRSIELPEAHWFVVILS